MKRQFEDRTARTRRTFRSQIVSLRSNIKRGSRVIRWGGERSCPGVRLFDNVSLGREVAGQAPRPPHTDADHPSRSQSSLTRQWRLELTPPATSDFDPQRVTVEQKRRVLPARGGIAALTYSNNHLGRRTAATSHGYT